MRTKLAHTTGAFAEIIGRNLVRIPGVAAIGCAVTGTAVLWGAGWAFLTATAFLLALDWRIR